ncbi:MAG: hypothetical protein ACNYNX_01585 [Leucobacter sp.]
MSELRVFGSAARYVQGPGAIDQVGAITGHLGDRVAVLIDSFMHPVQAERAGRSLDGAGSAHAATRGLMAVPTAAAHLHGEHVAYGLMLQLALAEEPDEVLEDIAGFLREMGLPDSLRAFGVEALPEVVDTIVSRR